MNEINRMYIYIVSTNLHLQILSRGMLSRNCQIHVLQSQRNVTFHTQVINYPQWILIHDAKILD